MNSATPPEFSRRMALDRATVAPQSCDIAASAAEREALARRFGLLSLDRLTAHFSWQRLAGGLVRLDGELEAELSQACVVTLEPVPARLAERFTLRFGRGAAAAGGEVVIDPEADDPPEPLGDGSVDLGEIVAQQLAVALDPYPRREGAAVETELPAQANEPVAGSPFEALAALKRKH